MSSTSSHFKYKWPITIGIVIGTILIVLFAFWYKLPTHSKVATTQNNNSDKNKKAIISVATMCNDTESPYLKTGIENIFYTIDQENNISFYQYSGKKFNHIKTTKTIKVPLNYNKEKVNLQLSLITKDGKTEGYGIYSNPQSTALPYLFAKLTDNLTTKDDYKYLIYTDTSYARLYSNAKTYQMAYALNPEKKTVHKLFSDVGLPVEENGLPSSTFIIIPDDYTGKSTDAFYFLSDRNYESGTMYDLYKKDGISKKEELVCEGVTAPILIAKDNATYFFKSNENDTSLTQLCKYADNTVKKYETFSGDPSKFLAKGEYILDLNSKKLYNPFTNYEKGLVAPISISNIQDFAVNSDGTKLAIAGNFAGNSEKLLFIKLSSNHSKVQYKIIDNTNLFISNNSNIIFLDDAVYFLSPSEKENAVTNLVLSWDAIFSIK